MSHGKSISVAMCTYNGAKFLKEQLESIAAQTRLPMELVICDDRSTDSTIDIIEAFASSAPFPVKLKINPVNLGGSAKGITKNFEQAAGLCTGDLIAFCDQDDVWLPQKLASLAKMMEEERLGGIFSDAQLMSDLGVPKGILLSETTGMTRKEHGRLVRGEVLRVLLSMTKVYGCTFMVDACLLDKILPVPPHWWFDAWVPCMVAVYSKLAFLPEPLFFYRIHAAQSGVGASLPTASDRVKQWKVSAKEYWQASEPQLIDLYTKLAAENSSSMEPYLRYVRGRMDLLRFRAELPSNPLPRMIKVISHANNYHQFFNGWKTMIKDITA